MSTFKAKYAGTCQDCGGSIEVGDEVVYAGTKVVHANDECGIQVAARESPQTGRVCTSCWTERSVTGACACEPD